MLRYALLLLAGLLIGTFLGHFAADAAPLKADDTRAYTFHYRDKSELKITTFAENRCAAYRIAAKMCYNILTGGSATAPGPYPGEATGLEIIDICANPTNFQP